MHGLIDLHNHTTRCCHATGTMDAYVERAMSLGLRDFGFSDHSHWMLRGTGKRYSMLAEELDAYVADVQQLQSRYNRDGTAPFNIRLGMEMDFRSTSTFQGLPPKSTECCKSLIRLGFSPFSRSSDVQRNPLTAGTKRYIKWYINAVSVPRALLLEEPG